jgi:hypothetical protein
MCVLLISVFKNNTQGNNLTHRELMHFSADQVQNTRFKKQHMGLLRTFYFSNFNNNQISYKNLKFG